MGFLERLVPEKQRRRDLAMVAALLLTAATLSASLPGGWADQAAASSTDRVTADEALLAVLADTLDPNWPTDTPEDVLTPPPLPTGPTPSPAGSPTPAPAKTRTVYSYVALGDSLTAWPVGGPWPTLLDSVDANLRLANNAGVPGDLTADMLARCPADVWPYKPDVLFILGGTNDLGHGVAQSTAISHLRSIVIGARSRRVHLFLMKIPPTSSVSDVATIDSFNAAIVNLGNIYSIVVIDIHTPLSASDGTIVSKYTTDGLHLSSLGVRVVVSAIYNRIHKLGY
jgi:lysophospholipase L1-like esterase